MLKLNKISNINKIFPKFVIFSNNISDFSKHNSKEINKKK